MYLTKEDFKDKYVLGGRQHDPSKNETLWEKYRVGCFTVIFDNLTDDTSAIIEADGVVQSKFDTANVGEQLSATLWFNGRIVKNYPKQAKLSY